jgi:hypothetical protein
MIVFYRIFYYILNNTVKLVYKGHSRENVAFMSISMAESFIRETYQDHLFTYKIYFRRPVFIIKISTILDLK